jgi:translation initiation factor IF-1
VPDEPLQTTARVVSPIDSRAYRAELPNGKPVVAHLPGRLATLAAEIQPGSEVRVEISPYDLDRARITTLHPASPLPPPDS